MIKVVAIHRFLGASMHEDRMNIPADSDELERQAYRMRMAELVVGCALLQSAVLIAFARVGTVAGWIAMAFAAVSVGSSLIFLAIFKLGLNLRFQDKEFAVSQCLVAMLIQFGFILVAPKLATLFLLVLLVIFAFGLVQFSLFQFAAGWLTYSVVSGVALWLVRDQFGYPGVSDAEVVLVWLFFSVTLGFFLFSRAQNSRLRADLFVANKQFLHSLAKIEALGRHDPLTGVLNRRTLMETLEAELLRAHRTGHPFCFAIIDIDHFRAVNDKFGSRVGDVVLKTMADTAMKLLRAMDCFGRIGGEEFGILFPATWLDQGVIAMGRLSKKVDECDWAHIAPGLIVTFSAGITTNAVNDTAEILIKRADDALSQAKREGRNRVVQAEQALPEMPATPDLD